MLDALAIAGLGFGLGLRHATDADHVVAVTTIVSQSPTMRRAATIGALWGIGHSVTLLVVGGTLLLTHTQLPPRLGLALELAVAAMLRDLGVRNIWSRGEPHAHGHTHAPAARRRRPLVVGLVHGLAGSAAVALLAVTAIPDPLSALGYLLVFGLGTIGGMVLVTLLVATPAALAGAHLLRWHRPIRIAAGTLSVLFGLLLAWEIVVDGQLFGRVPVWEPR